MVFKKIMEGERAEKLRALLDAVEHTVGHQLYGLWDEIGENEKIKLKFVKNLSVFWDVIVKNTMLRRRFDYTFVSHILLRFPHNFDPCHVFCCPGLDQSTQRDRSQTVEDHFKVKHRLKHNCEDNGSFFSRACWIA